MNQHYMIISWINITVWLVICDAWLSHQYHGSTLRDAYNGSIMDLVTQPE